MFPAVELFIALEPCPQERIRFRFQGRGRWRRIIPYYPAKTRNFQNTIRTLVQEYMQAQKVAEFPKDCPLELHAIFYIARPKSTKRAHPIVRPDLSNYLKALEDGLQRSTKDGLPSLLEDDSSIIRIVTEKRYLDAEHQEPGIYLRLGAYDGTDNNPPAVPAEEVSQTKKRTRRTAK